MLEKTHRGGCGGQHSQNTARWRYEICEEIMETLPRILRFLPMICCSVYGCKQQKGRSRGSRQAQLQDCIAENHPWDLSQRRVAKKGCRSCSVWFSFVLNGGGPSFYHDVGIRVPCMLRFQPMNGPGISNRAWMICNASARAASAKSSDEVTVTRADAKWIECGERRRSVRSCCKVMSMVERFVASKISKIHRVRGPAAQSTVGRVFYI